jgi:hypothetical protein
MRRLWPVLALLGGWGCAGVRFDGRTVTKAEVVYQVGPLEGRWRQVTLADNDLAYLSGDSSGHSMAVNSTCRGYGDPPLSVLTRDLLSGFTERKETGREVLQLDGREALRTRHTAKLDGVALDLLFVVMKKDGCVYDFTYLSPPGHFDERVADFNALVAGFHVVSRS